MKKLEHLLREARVDGSLYNKESTLDDSVSSPIRAPKSKSLDFDAGV